MAASDNITTEAAEKIPGPNKTGEQSELEKSLFREVVETIGLAVILAIILRTFVIQAFFIPSGSMENTLLPGDMILVNKFIYYFTDYKHGDIIVFKYPKEPEKDYIKRVIGLPGDTVEIKNGDIYINDKLTEEKYTKQKAADDIILHASAGADVPLSKIKVPEGKLFVMGDNRNNSQDSRFWGYLPKENIRGKALLIYWPLNRIGLIR
ncbi:MAG: signal peptidase I [Candidatus Wallbacteria bacterium]